MCPHLEFLTIYRKWAKVRKNGQESNILLKNPKCNSHFLMAYIFFTLNSSSFSQKIVLDFLAYELNSVMILVEQFTCFTVWIQLYFLCGVRDLRQAFSILALLAPAARCVLAVGAALCIGGEFSSLSGFWPLDANSIFSVVTVKNIVLSSDIAQCLLGGEKLTLVAENHGFKEGARIEGRENWT